MKRVKLEIKPGACWLVFAYSNYQVKSTLWASKSSKNAKRHWGNFRGTSRTLGANRLSQLSVLILILHFSSPEQGETDLT